MQIVESSPVVIRLASFQDRKEIIQLEKLAIQNLCQDNYNVEQIEVLTSKVHQLHFNDEIIFVAEKERNLIGFASLLSYRKIVRTLYVKANFIHQKIETELLNAIEKEAINQKIEILKVISSLTERDFYQARGYQDIAFCSLSKMDILIPGIIMQKRLMPIRPYKLLFKKLFQTALASFPNLFFLLLLI
jgi:putative acetyltransferase